MQQDQKHQEYPLPPAYDDVVKDSARFPTAAPIFTTPINTSTYHHGRETPYKRPRLGRDPIRAICHMCRMQVVTDVDFRTSFFTHATAMSVACIGFWPIAWVPYAFDVFKRANHYCPQCHAYIGKE